MDKNKPPNFEALASYFTILYEDESLIVIDKPPHIHSAMVPTSEEPSVAEIISKIIPQQSEVSSKTEDSGLVNRLDFETSGILLIAKTREAWMALRSALLSDSVNKTYLALVEGCAPEEKLIENYIGTPNRRGAKVKVYTRTPKKKDRALPAKSLFKRVKFREDKDASLVRVSLQSARRHQIRAHASFMGHPLVGDALYGSSRTLAEVIEGLNRTFFLHAETLTFTHPVTEKEMTISSPPPKEVQSW